MHQNVCRTNYSNVLCMKFKFEKFQFFGQKQPKKISKCSECINMHRNASKCMQNELCKCFVHELVKEVVFITFKYRIVWKTTPRYMIFSPKNIRIIHEVLKYLCSDNADFMAIFSHYIPGRVIIQVALYSRLYGRTDYISVY